MRLMCKGGSLPLNVSLFWAAKPMAHELKAFKFPDVIGRRAIAVIAASRDRAGGVASA